MRAVAWPTERWWFGRTRVGGGRVWRPVAGCVAVVGAQTGVVGGVACAASEGNGGHVPGTAAAVHVGERGGVTGRKWEGDQRRGR